MLALDPYAFWAVVLVVGFAGLLIGSFLNVVVYRLPAGLSLSTPPSACPTCRTPIKAYDNIPLISWILLRGRCRQCEGPISARYPLVEAGTAVFFGLVALIALANFTRSSSGSSGLSGTVVLLAYLYFAAISVALGLIDLDTHRLPNQIVFPAYAVAAVLFATASLVDGHLDSLFRAGVGMAGMFLAYFAMAIAYPGGMGFGDVKLAGLVGIFLGWAGWGALIVGAFSAFLLGGLVAIALLLLRKATRKSGIPFGPWILVGAWTGVGVGNAVFASYLTIFGLSAA